MFSLGALPPANVLDEWTEPEGVLCRLYSSDIVKFGVNPGWPKNVMGMTKRTLQKDAATAVRTHERFAACVAYAASMPLGSEPPAPPAPRLPRETGALPHTHSYPPPPPFHHVDSPPSPVDHRGLAGMNTESIIDGTRERSAPDRFSETECMQWSAYDMSRLVSRHERVHGIREACSTEPALSAELDALFSRVRSAASAPTGSDPASDLVGGMERGAATALHSAVIECMRAAGIDSHFAVPACMPDWHTPTEEGHWGKLVIMLPSIKWIPETESSVESVECMACMWSGRSRNGGDWKKVTLRMAFASTYWWVVRGKSA